jgi:hypothetical protein
MSSSLVILIPLALIAIVVLVIWARARNRTRFNELHKKRRAFIEAYRFPPELSRRLRDDHPELGPGGIELALLGLRQYFLACLSAQRGAIARELGMPSKAVDDAWHEFILMTREYQGFCRRAFGNYLHHTPRAQMREPLDNALANTLHQFNKHDAATAGLTTLGATPLLFAIDRHLGVADGFRYDDSSLGTLEQKRRALLLHRKLQYASESHGGCSGGAVGCDSSSGSGCGDGGGASCSSGGCGGGGGCSS